MRAIVLLLFLAACGAPDVCSAKAEFFRHCRNEAVTDDQVTACTKKLPVTAPGCTKNDLTAQADYYSCRASDCMSGESESKSALDCAHFVDKMSTVCTAP